MPVEIERKFLVIDDRWRNRAPGARFCQGYLTNTGVTVRVRRAGSRAYLTVKGPQRGGYAGQSSSTRSRWTKPRRCCAVSAKSRCWRRRATKSCTRVISGSWMSCREQRRACARRDRARPPRRAFCARPGWIGREVSHDPSYRNSVLADEPKGWHSGRSAA